MKVFKRITEPVIITHSEAEAVLVAALTICSVNSC